MPGEYALRGGIVDVYSPEAERPVRIEFFGDEVESIRRFDPASQRSSNPMDEALLLPLTETPVSDQLLGAIHARLSGKRIAGSEEIVEAAVRAGGVTTFPGWEFYAPLAGADRSVFDLLPRAAILLDEPDLLRTEFDRFWTRVEEAHERSGVGNLVRPIRSLISCARRLVAESRVTSHGRWTYSISASPVPKVRTLQSISSPSPLRVSTARFRPCSSKFRSSPAKASRCYLPFPTPAKSSAWPTFSPSTTLASAWEAAPAAAKVTPTKPVTSPAKF